MTVAASRQIRPRPRRNALRDRDIISDHRQGCAITTLAARYSITPGRVATIIRIAALHAVREGEQIVDRTHPVWRCRRCGTKWAGFAAENEHCPKCGWQDCPCGWWLDEDIDDGTWATSCGHMFRLDDGSPCQNRMAFCCYCGKPLTEVTSGKAS